MKQALKRAAAPADLDLSRSTGALTSDQKLLGGYQPAQLERAFELVQNPEHWKGKVDAVVDVPSSVDLPALVDLLRYAVPFYTATEATVTREGRALRVEADGYWCGPAA